MRSKQRSWKNKKWAGVTCLLCFKEDSWKLYVTPPFICAMGQNYLRERLEKCHLYSRQPRAQPRVGRHSTWEEVSSVSSHTAPLFTTVLRPHRFPSFLRQAKLSPVSRPLLLQLHLLSIPSSATTWLVSSHHSGLSSNVTSSKTFDNCV